MKSYDPSTIEPKWPRKVPRNAGDHGVNKTYDPSAIEPGWQKIWEREGLYRAHDFDKRKKYYVLVEFPYPSGERLHVGHGRSYCALDSVARMTRMKGKNVLFPMGWDAFGLPAENYALKTGIHPSLTTRENIEAAKKQVKSWGLSFDWEREINTTDPSYYKWTQWIFLQFFKKGLAYKAEIPVNWCPQDKINLADEEVVGGCCERCGTKVEKRVQSQWMLKITDYADRLLEDLEGVDYPEHVKEMQRNWIGKSQGALVKFPLVTGLTKRTRRVEGSRTRRVNQAVEIFTTRLDTIFGATFLVLAPEHPLIRDGILPSAPPKIREEIRDYVRKAMQKSELERSALGGQARGGKDLPAEGRTGIFTGLYAKNPATQEDIPVWISGFVLPHYGTGAIMAVPAHDQRDFEFAKAFDLPIRVVVEPVGETRRVSLPAEGGNSSTRRVNRRVKLFQAFIEDGILINSDQFSTLDSASARKKLLEWLGKRGLAKEAVTYRLRDWVFSRQHYWGEPIPLIYCGKCASEGRSWFTTEEGRSAVSKIKNLKLKVKNDNLKFKIGNWKLETRLPDGQVGNFERLAGWYPAGERELPVELPYIERYQPTGTGKSPLAKAVEWVNVDCPECGSEAKRETDTMPNWAGSSWYFLAYTFWHKLGDQKSPPKADPPLAEKIKNEKFENAFMKYRREVDYWMGPPRKDARRAPRSPAKAGRSGVDWYNGGLEHTTLHLLYSRFWYKFLGDLGLVPGKEPFAKRTSHGVVLGPDGYKMSKSRGNVVNPDEVIAEFGADAFRIYEMFMGPFDQTIAWDPRGVLGVRRFLDRVWKIHQIIVGADRVSARGENVGADRTSAREDVGADRVSARGLVRKLHQLIRKTEEDLENLKFNTAVAAMMEFVNDVHARNGEPQKEPDGLKASKPVGLTVWDWEIFLRILAPFAPHLAEELFQDIKPDGFPPKADPPLAEKNPKPVGFGSLTPFPRGGSVHQQPWPSYDPKLLVEEEISIPVQVNGKLRGMLEVQSSKSKVQSEVEKLAKADPKIARYLEGKTVERVIFIPDKLINFVLGG